MAVRIITDSASDFQPEIALDEKIDVVPLAVQFGDTTYWDGKTIAKEQFYQLLQEGSVNPTTSQPTPDAFLQRFEAARDAGDEVVVISSPAPSAARCKARSLPGICAAMSRSTLWTAVASLPVCSCWWGTPAGCETKA